MRWPVGAAASRKLGSGRQRRHGEADHPALLFRHTRSSHAPLHCSRLDHRLETRHHSRSVASPMESGRRTRARHSPHGDLGSSRGHRPDDRDRSGAGRPHADARRRDSVTRRLALVLLVGGCAAARPAPATGLSFPSELPPDAALGLARNVLRRSGWPVAGKTEAPGRRAFATEWHETAGGPVRLLVDATEADGGASTTVTVRGEVRLGRGVMPLSRPGPSGPASPAWAAVEAAARQVGAEVRYARP